MTIDGARASRAAAVAIAVAVAVAMEIGCTRREEYVQTDLPISDAPRPDPPRPPRFPPALVPVVVDAGPPVDAATPADPAAAPRACIAACEARFPSGAKKARAIDECWAAKCAACQDMPDRDALAPAASGACKAEVWTPSSACSQCTVDACCSAWDGCFGDAECSALNDCATACGA